MVSSVGSLDKRFVCGREQLQKADHESTEPTATTQPGQPASKTHAPTEPSKFNSADTYSSESSSTATKQGTQHASLQSETPRHTLARESSQTLHRPINPNRSPRLLRLPRIRSPLRRMALQSALVRPNAHAPRHHDPNEQPAHARRASNRQAALEPVLAHRRQRGYNRVQPG